MILTFCQRKCGAWRGQKRALDPLELKDGCKLPCGWWKLDPLEELTSVFNIWCFFLFVKSSIFLKIVHFKKWKWYYLLHFRSNTSMLLRNYMAWASGMAQLLKALATKPNNFRWFLGIHMVKGENQLLQIICLCVCLPPHLSITQLIIRVTEEEKKTV